MRKRQHILLILLIALFAIPAYTQSDKPKNRAGDFSGKKRRFHFGFALAYNKSSFFYDLKPDFTFEDSLLSLNVESAPGFNLNIISSLHINNNWKLRFLPGLSFQERVLNFRFLDKDGEVVKETDRIESTFVDFPLLLKWRTDRINNWCVYLLGGGQYSLDMASRQQVNGNENIVRIKRGDQALVIGGGFDFFLKYFKFGVELKLNAGIPNIYVEDNNLFSDPISRIRTKSWVLSLTFEG